MGEFAPYRPANLPPSALAHFQGQVETILRGYDIDLSGTHWVPVDQSTIQTLDFTYQRRPLHLYTSIRHTELGFGISYLSDFGTREVISASPAVAPVEAAAAIQRTLTRVWSAQIPVATA